MAIPEAQRIRATRGNRRPPNAERGTRNAERQTPNAKRSPSSSLPWVEGVTETISEKVQGQERQ
jgi:hypothetical protein